MPVTCGAANWMFQAADCPRELNERSPTMTATDPANNTMTATPNISVAELRLRYKHVREPILVALHLLLQDNEISIGDAKAKAGAMGTRITLASILAARRLMAKMDAAPPAPAAAPVATTAPTRPARRPRAPEAAQDTEALVRGVVAKVRAQEGAESERLRAAIRRAVELLNSALA
jgi:hypothetical protein